MNALLAMPFDEVFLGEVRMQLHLVYGRNDASMSEQPFQLRRGEVRHTYRTGFAGSRELFQSGPGLETLLIGGRNWGVATHFKIICISQLGNPIAVQGEQFVAASEGDWIMNPDRSSV
jgi:hypothetical protein